MKIQTYIINLKKRTDRYQHILNEFEHRNEFQLNVIEAKTHHCGAVGLWESIKYIVGDLASENDDFILICEDDHLFTADYSPEKLRKMISEAKHLNADALIGGVSWFNDAVQVSDELFWTKKFSGTQFLIIFKKFFKLILNADFNEMDTADTKISSLSDSIYFSNPFISVQKEFGYSDATEDNNEVERVQNLFLRSAIRAKISSNIRLHYGAFPKLRVEAAELDDFSIPTYIINLADRKERLNHIRSEFLDKPEFDIQIIEAVKHDIGGTGLWMSMKKAVSLAIKNDDDVIVICEDDHEFTEDYDKHVFLNNILIANEHGCDYINCGTGEFDLAVPVTEELIWVNHCLSGQLLVIFKRFYQTILDAPMEDDIMPDIKISKLTQNKLVLAPIISTQRNFGYSDVTKLHHDQPEIVKQMFHNSLHRLMTIKLAYLMHNRNSMSVTVRDQADAFFNLER